MPAKTAWQLTCVLLIEYISISAVTAAYGFALTATHFFYKRLKKVSKKTLAPSVRPLAKARRSFAPVSIWGHRPTVGFASTYMRWVRLRRTVLRANPQMNTTTLPPEGAGGSRSKTKAKAKAKANPSPSAVFLALAGGWAIRNARYFFSVTGPRVCGVFVSRKMSITYRGSAYEQFWDTYFFATVARTLRGDSGWLRQSAASATRCAATATGSYLSNFRKHRCAG